MKFAFGEGRPLYDAYRATEGRDFDPAPVTTTVAKKEDEWDGLVRLTMQVENCNYSKAVDLLTAGEAGHYAFRKRLRKDRIASDVGFTVADMEAINQADDACEALAKRDDKTRYGRAFDEVQQAHPQMKASKIHDFLQQTKRELWEEHKLGKLGGGNLPQLHPHERSGEEPPKATSGRSGRAPAQWRSDHSGSPATTDEPEPEHPSDRPAVKAIARIARRTGFGPERLTMVLKSVPEGRKLIHLALQEVR